MSVNVLFEPITLGSLALRNRIVMPAMVRMRARHGLPHPAAAEYYAQRAAAGLIVGEATAVSEDAPGYPGMAGIFTAKQVDAWRAIVDAVHDEGGLMVLQLVHHGRRAHSSNLPPGMQPVAPSPVAASGSALTTRYQWSPFETPRALSKVELDTMVSHFWRAARHAIDAGFDGVEINAANGSLLDQFLHDGANRRDDDYGGTVNNRVRLLFDIVDAISDAIGPDLTAVRLSPFGRMGGLVDSDPVALYREVFNGLAQRSLAYLHLIEPELSSATVDRFTEEVRANFRGPLISAGGHTPETAAHAVSEGIADAVAFGRLFVANPDLPLRLQLNLPLNRPDAATLFGGGERGYTDYAAIARFPKPTLRTIDVASVPHAADLCGQ